MERKHWGQHDVNCFACKIQSVGIGQPSDMPTRKPAAVASKQYERTRERDIAAYKRLRKEGLEVRGTSGAHRLEREARTEFELKTGMIAPTASLSRQTEEGNKEVVERMAVAAKESAG